MVTEIRQKTFFTKKDICMILTGKESPSEEEITSNFINKIFAKARKEAIEELKSKGMILPDKSHIPSIYVWKNLKAYGIKK